MIYDLRDYNKELEELISSGQTFRKLYKWLQEKCPYHSDELIVRHLSSFGVEIPKNKLKFLEQS